MDTDFDFGDLVTMTIVDVFETDCEGKLLSYCPTFDNRAVVSETMGLSRLVSFLYARECWPSVNIFPLFLTFPSSLQHKTQEVTERIKKSASHLKERVDVVVKSPTGQKYIRVRTVSGCRAITCTFHPHRSPSHSIQHKSFCRRHRILENEGFNPQSSWATLSNTKLKKKFKNGSRRTRRPRLTRAWMLWRGPMWETIQRKKERAAKRRMRMTMPRPI